MNTLLLSDAYKQSHRIQYPSNTVVVYSNWIPRTDKRALVKGGVVVFGIQPLLYKLNEWFGDKFFNLPLKEVKDTFIKEYTQFFGVEPDINHVIGLHNLGYLPIRIKALPEGSICPIGVPMLTVVNTHKDFPWITNFLETIMSTELWQPMTSATIAHGFKKLLNNWADRTCDNKDHVMFQAHDFSMRGMAGLESAMASGAGALTSFYGTDTIPAVAYVNKFYAGDNGLIGTSIPATEHSVMSMGTKESEIDTFRRLINEIYPEGLISIVSDTWDLWKVLTEYIPELKQDILARDGKVIIRPDSGDPVDIICGCEYQPKATDEFDSGWKRKSTKEEEKGVVELLWDIFGGTINSKGYKILDSHIGAIYGDAITYTRADAILERLEAKGFASSNIVFGTGSFTYQYNTRDTYGFAMKATYGELLKELSDGTTVLEPRNIYKDPITGDGTKKSLKGLVQVKWDEIQGKYTVKDQCTWHEEEDSELVTVYKDSIITQHWSFQEVRENLKKFE